MSDPLVDEFEKRTGNQLPTRSKGVLSELVETKTLALKNENESLRELLWIEHHKHNPEHLPYGDDGRRDCNTCGIFFSDDSIETLEFKMASPERKDFLKFLETLGNTNDNNK